MSGVGKVTIAWRNGEDEFCLAAVGNILALEEKCGAGIMAIMQRLQNDSWGINDVREPIRLGLIGGGMAPEKALMAVKLHVDGNPNGIGPSVILAHTILQVVLIGVPGDPVGKTKAPEAKTQGLDSSTKTAASDAQPSSESDKTSDGDLATLTPHPSGKLPLASPDITEPTPPATDQSHL